tara:strand:+ start:1739 stop:1975 length:237 start_codon:yes stop_codon:yes gene_type:complete
MKIGDLVKVNFYGFDQDFFGILLPFNPLAGGAEYGPLCYGHWTISYTDGSMESYHKDSFDPNAFPPGEMTVEVISESR